MAHSRISDLMQGIQKPVFLLASLTALLLSVFVGDAAAGSVTVSPTSLSFGNQVLNTASSTKSIKLSNGQSTAITITSFVFSLSDYTQTNNCPISPNTRRAGGSCTIT